MWRRAGEAGNRVAALALVCLAYAGSLLCGCGTPGAPQPPSLKLPEPVTDLSAVRAGNAVTLHWTTPRRTTDRLLIRGAVTVSVCRRESASQSCVTVGHASSLPRAEGEFRDTLPASLTRGPARELLYSVELLGPKDRSAAPSNTAIVLAGQAPEPVSGLSAKVRADGVAFHWDHADETTRQASVRLHRKLLTIPKEKPKSGLAEAGPEPVLRDLLAPPPGLGQQPGALDTSARFGQSYEYTAQRVLQVTLDGVDGVQKFELAGPVSPPIRVDVVDNFPPAIPQELAAVFVGEQHSIDLSWQPDTESDLAGYIVYRSVDGGEWIRISGPAPVDGPAYRDPTVEKGRSYRYAVSAIDQTGHESKRSTPVSESTPTD